MKTQSPPTAVNQETRLQYQYLDNNRKLLFLSYFRSNKKVQKWTDMGQYRMI